MKTTTHGKVGESSAVHLVVIQPDASRNYETFSPDAHDFRWNDDYTAFRPMPLSWTSDASYAAYQARDDEE